ncbi:transcription factor E2F4-like [Solea senegalensis]|uniref:Transcription factor E2F4-like n=1 Tax=Solea senegalensis TaxID=28829 RepID=A0AAV6Q5F9_SOLSE|nr:transcription factor E2F4-like [Solea senegalensis]
MSDEISSMNNKRSPDCLDSEATGQDPLPKIPRIMKSLQLIAIGFVKLLQEAEGGVVDIQDAAKILASDQKRRIYDITNVLEGVGLIMKISKRKVKWIGANPGQETFDRRVLELKCELDDLEQNICNCFRGHTLLAVKAPSGIHLDVPIPKASLRGPVRYQIHMKSAGGPIDILLLSTNSATSDPVTLPVPPPEDVLRNAKLATHTSDATGGGDAPADAVHWNEVRQTDTQQDTQRPYASSFLTAKTNRMDSPLMQNLSKELRKLLDPTTEITKADIFTKLISSEVFPALRHLFPTPPSQCDSDQTLVTGNSS